MKARRFPAIALAVLCALSVLAAIPAGAGAHPLGNFSVNRLTQVRISEDTVEVRYLLDQAEIPTFQEIQRFDADGSETIEGAERRPLLRRKLDEIASGLELSVDGRAMELGPALDPVLSYPPGQGGLLLTRIEASFEAALPAGASEVELRDETFGDRVGWKAIQALPGEGTEVRTTVPATDPTGGLRAYPEDLLQSPLDQRRASFSVSEGQGTVTAPGGPDGGPVTTDRALDGFAGTLTGGDAHGLLLLALLGAAFGWGALHALSPGHGKAMVAGYLVGSRGTPRHAAVLGLAVTITHTSAVFALGLVTLFASEYVLPEDLYPWLGVASGVMVVAIGLAVMRSRFRRWRSLRAAEDRGGGDRHGHHRRHRHHHAPPDGAITMRGLLALGVSGGLVPCPSALVVLIAAISQHRVGLGMALIVAFSLGLAATLTAVGLVVLCGGRLVARLRPESRLFGGRLVGALPAVSAIVIVLAGTLITVRAIPAVSL
jgi:nickel/cobalt transporter (NicO) family protein